VREVATKDLTATAVGVTAVAIERVYEHLLAVECYPEWYPDGAKSVTVLERDAEGAATTVDAVLAAVAGPLRKAFDVRLSVVAIRPTSIALARVPDERGEHETLTITWLLRDLAPDGTELSAEFGARMDVPRFIPIDPVAREVANGFLQAALASLRA
jgi:Polyketide cyclase / dehydrase and lipid transport